MTSLYQLSNEYLQIQNKLIEADFDEQTIANTLESISGDLTAKAVNVAMFIKNVEATAEAIKQAEKNMADRRKSLEKKAETIRDYLKNNMQACNMTKIECPYFALTIKKNPPAVVIDDTDAIPTNLFVCPEPPLPFPDKKAIAELLKNGVEVPGAHLEQNERLDIK
jgi:hypothetical protein